MEVVIIIIAIVLLSLIMPYINYVKAFIRPDIFPPIFIQIIFLAIAIKLILFVIHRGDEG